MKKILVLTFALIFATTLANAQFIEDALRFIKSNTYPNARAAALGFSYFGFSDDAAALVTNPAGMTLIPMSEIGLGLNLTHHNVETDYLSNNREDKKNDFYFSNVQFVMPSYSLNDAFRVSYGFSYSLDNDFDNNTRFSGYNTENSFIGQQSDARQHWTTYTGVADSNYNTLAANNLMQEGYIKESGGLHNLSFAAAMDFSGDFSFGATLNLKFGSYDYSKRYIETDINNLHNTYWVDDLWQLQVRDKLTQDLIGVSGIIGFQYRLNDFLRIGLAMQIPTLLAVTEHFSSEYNVQFDPDSLHPSGDTQKYLTGESSQDYTMITPFEFKLGVSGSYMGVSYSVAGSILDASSAYFNRENDYDTFDDLLYFDDLNDAISENLSMQYTFGIGLEYKIPPAPVYVRGGWSIVTSPYKDSDLGSTTNIFGLGVGLLLSENFVCDIAFNYNTYDVQRANYGNADAPRYFAKYNAGISASSYMLGFRYRFN
ncbi:MAG: hypothetical protein LBO69_02895 [Ignavibacteria bacterium]|nr:hypothetical protein [Ignavibacteria bacterium]